MESALIVARCSTNEKKQDVQRQVQDLSSKYMSMYDIVDTFSYYKSGTQNNSINDEIIEIVKQNKIQNIIVSEVSRLSRKVIDFLKFVEVTNELGVNIVIDNHGLNTLESDKSVNLITKTMLTIGATFAEMELQSTIQRMHSGREKYIRDGGKLGRKQGTKETIDEFIIKHKDVVRRLKRGESIRTVMANTNKSSGTVQKVKRIITSTTKI